MKRLGITAGAVLVLLIAVSSVWHTVRMEWLLWGAEPVARETYNDDAMFREADILGQVVVEVVLVEGVGSEPQPVTLAAGTWRATTEAVDHSIDDTHIIGTSRRGSRLSWSSGESRPAVFVVGDFGRTQATLYGRGFIIRTNAVEEDHPWSVTLERFGQPGIDAP